MEVDQKTNRVDNNVKEDELQAKLERKFFRHFLPLVHSEKSYSKCFLSDNPYGLRLWNDGSNGKVLISLPPPPTIKEDPEAKPRRLGQLIKRLAWCYRQPLSGKVKMANQVLRELFKATDKVAVAF